MPSRVLETVLTGRNLLSPVLTGAAADVTAFDAKVAASQEKASTSAQTSARAQVKASDQVVAANTRTAASSSEASAKVTAANTRNAETSTSASSKVVAANARAAESSRAFGEVTESSAARAHAAWSSLATKGLPLLGVAAAVVFGKMAGDYQQLVTKLATTAGAGVDQEKALGQGMLDMAGQVGISAKELATGMYTVESSLPGTEHGAKRTSDALLILKASAQGARQENADLGKVADAVSTILHDYHLPASQAANVTSELVSAVSHGKTTFDLLTGSLHSITPLASVLHISLADVTGTLSSMTASGESADQATQNMADTLRHLANPTNTMIAEMAQLGISTNDLSASLSTRGLSGTLQYLEQVIVDHVDPATKKVLLPALNQSKTAAQDLKIMIGSMPGPLAKMSQGLLDGSTSVKDYTKAAKDLGGHQAAMALQFLGLVKSSQGFSNILKAGGPAAQVFEAALAKTVGTSAGLNVMLQTTGENAAATNAAVKDIGASTADTAGNIKGWSEVQGNFNQKLAQASAEAKTLAIEAGQHLLPVLTGMVGWVGSTGLPAIGHLGSGIGDLVHDFSQLPGPVKLAMEVMAGLALVNATGLFAKLGDVILTTRIKMLYFTDSTTANMAVVSNAYRTAAASAGELAAVQGSAGLRGAVSGIAGLGAAAGATAKVGFGALRTAGSGLVNFLGGPWVVGIGAAVGALMYFRGQIQQHNEQVKAATDDVKSWYEAMASKGGQAGLDGMVKINEKQREIAATQAKLNDLQKNNVFISGRGGAQLGLSNVAIAQMAQHLADLRTESEKGKKAWDDYYNSLDPSGKASANVARYEGDIAYAVATHTTNTTAGKNAIINYNSALAEQKRITDGVSAAEQTQIEKLQQIADVQLGAVSSALAATQAQSQWSDALTQYSKDAKDGQHSTKQLADESNNLASQAIGVAQALGKQVHDQLKATGAADDGAQANKVMLDSLKKQADQLTGPGHDALMKAYYDLLRASTAADTMTGAAHNMGLNVVKTFNNNTVVIAGATAAQITDLQKLGDKVTHLPDGNIIVTTDTHMARAGLDALINDYNNKVIRVGTSAGVHVSSATGPSGTTTKNAEGGHFRGAGTGTSDSNLSWISDGEFIVKASQTAKHLPLLHAINDGALPAYANGGRAGRLNMYETIPADLSAAAVAQAHAAIAQLAAQAAAMGNPGGAPSSVSGNAATVQRVAGQYGWASGAEWDALYNVIMRESGFRNTAQNPTSSAYGMFQFLDPTWAGYGVSKTSDALFQSVAGLKYIAQKYGDPLGAYRHEQQFGWYRDGTNFVPSDQLAVLHRGEAVVPAAVNQGRPFTPTGAPGYSSSTVGRTVITVAAPQVTLQARVFIGTREITDIVRIEAATVVDHKLGQLADTIHYSGG